MKTLQCLLLASLAVGAGASLIASLPPAVPAPVRGALEKLETILLATRDPSHWPLLKNTTDSTYCPDQGAFDWVPITTANLSATTPSSQFSGNGCFSTLTASAVFTPIGVEVTIVGKNPRTLLCSDAYILTNSYSLSLPVEVSALVSTQKLTLKWDTPEEAQDVSLNGIHVALLPCGLVGSITSILETVNLFIPLSLNASDMEGINERFLNGRGIWNGPGGPNTPLVPFNTVQDLDPSVLRSGDYLAILRMDGLDPLIAFGTGFGATGHSAVCVWKGTGADRQLFIIESTDGPNIFGPPIFFGHGLTQTPFDQWIALARKAQYNVAVLPLTPTLSKNFNEDAVWAWFEPIKGTPYGYQNLLFAVLDTANPFLSLPSPIDEGVVIPVLNVADQVLGPAPPGNVSTSLTVDTLLVQGLNKRMGTACSTLACIIATANANKAGGPTTRPTSVLQAAAIPEDDTWRYGGEVVFVCSGFAAAVYKVAIGSELLADFNATEQTPTDNVKWGIWDGGYWSASNCPVGLWTPTAGNGTVWCVSRARCVCVCLHGFPCLLFLI